MHIYINKTSYLNLPWSWAQKHHLQLQVAQVIQPYFIQDPLLYHAAILCIHIYLSLINFRLTPCNSQWSIKPNEYEFLFK